MTKQNKEYDRTRFTFWFKNDLKNQLEQIAKQDDRSLSYMINKAIEKWLEGREKK